MLEGRTIACHRVTGLGSLSRSGSNLQIKGKPNIITHRITVLEIQTHHMLKTQTPPAPPLRQSSALFLLKIPQNPIFFFIMIQNLLVDGRARVLETLQRGYAPSHFSHNLELIFVKDSRSSASASMKTKIASTRERSARIRTLDPRTLIWWATAFPMRHWSGGRKISSSTFDGLIRYAPRCAAQAASLLPAVAADLDRLRQKHAKCTMLQNFLGGKQSHFRPLLTGTLTPSRVLGGA